MKTLHPLTLTFVTYLISVVSSVNLRHTQGIFCDQGALNCLPSMLTLTTSPTQHIDNTNEYKNGRKRTITKQRAPDGTSVGALESLENDEKSTDSSITAMVDNKQPNDDTIQLSTQSSADPPVNNTDQCILPSIDTLKDNPSIKALEYLGSGYDVIKSKPFGDQVTFVDTGYTQPIIKFSWRCNTKAPGKTSPAGVWMRREPACHKGHSTREINNEKSLSSLLSEDITTSFGLGILSVEHSAEKNKGEVADTWNKGTQVALKSQCAVFTAGMLLSKEWELKYAFRKALSPFLEFKGRQHCHKVEEYSKGGHCHDYYKLWKHLFSNYGTHIITRLTMGGKLLQIKSDERSRDTEASRKEAKQNSTVNIGFINAMLRKSKEKQNIMKKERKRQSIKCLIIGGDTFLDITAPNGWRRWTESVDQNSMPIKLQLTPLSQFIPSELRRDFFHAIKLYVKEKS